MTQEAGRPFARAVSVAHKARIHFPPKSVDQNAMKFPWRFVGCGGCGDPDASVGWGVGGGEGGGDAGGEA